MMTDERHVAVCCMILVVLIRGYLRVVRGAGKCGFSCIAARPVYTNDVKFFDKK